MPFPHRTWPLAFRRLRSQPGFVGTIVATLALGIGANVAVFSLANAILLRPLPAVKAPAGLAIVQFHDRDGRLRETSYPNLHALATAVPGFAGMAGLESGVPVAVQVPGEPADYLRATFVSWNYFQVLGTRVLVGRPLSALDERSAPARPTAVISYAFWHRHFRGSRNALGTLLSVNGVSTRVVGIAPPGFRGTDRLGDDDLWLPASAVATVVYHGAQANPLDERGDGVFSALVGRLARGFTLPRALGQLRTASARLVSEFPAENAQWLMPVGYAGIGVPVRARRAVWRMLAMLGGISALVMLLTCANVANLVLFRTMGRRTEWAVRTALGAPRVDLVRLQLTELLLLAGAAAVPAVALGALLGWLFRGRVLPGLGVVDPSQIDWRVCLFAALASVVAAGLSAVVPVLASLRTDPAGVVRASALHLSRSGGRVRNALATGQIALSLGLLVVTLLLVRTVHALRAVNVGFDADSVTTFAMSPMSSGYSRNASLGVLRSELERITAIPGVEGAALSAVAPFMPTLSATVRVSGEQRRDSGLPITPAWITPSYFRTMGVPLRAGRTFRANEMWRSPLDTAHSVIIVSQSIARRLFGSAPAIGRSLSVGPRNPNARIVGVVGDTRWKSLFGTESAPVAYMPLPNIVGVTGAVFLVRTPLSVRSLASAVRGSLDSLAPSVPLMDAMRLRHRIDRTVAAQRLLAKLLLTFTLLAVMLAGVGVYAIVSASIAERTREIGIRISVGASPPQVLRLVMRSGVMVGVTGSLLGLAIAAVLSRLVASELYGLSALDPGIYGLAAITLLAVTLLATLLPARRATKVDPVTALRVE